MPRLSIPSFPTAQHYIRSLNPSGYWPLGEASGDAVDLSGNGNDGVVTIGAGARDVAALDDGGDGGIDFDGAATKVDVADDASIQNPWDGGGACMFLLRPDGLGEGSLGTILYKTQWSLRVRALSGGHVSLGFRVAFSGATADWSTSTLIPTTGLGAACLLTYNAGTSTNDPTVHIFDLNSGTLSTLTVGAGITENTAPVGTRLTDAGTLTIGNNTSQSQSFDGVIDEVAVFKGAQPTLAQFQVWFAYALLSQRLTAATRTAAGARTVAGARSVA